MRFFSTNEHKQYTARIFGITIIFIGLMFTTNGIESEDTTLAGTILLLWSFISKLYTKNEPISRIQKFWYAVLFIILLVIGIIFIAFFPDMIKIGNGTSYIPLALIILFLIGILA